LTTCTRSPELPKKAVSMLDPCMLSGTSAMPSIDDSGTTVGSISTIFLLILKEFYL
jgi:hypothetical protein